MAEGNGQGEGVLAALGGVLEEFRKGHIGSYRRERAGLQRHLGDLGRQWDQHFPGFPQLECSYASSMGVFRRFERDSYLIRVMVRILRACKRGRDRIIVNPACVEGRQARILARQLADYRVIGTDIFGGSHWLYERLPGRSPGNYEFRQNNIFQPRLEVHPAAVVFFGACGSLSDAAMDYAIQAQADYLFCRSCCHDNIGGNTDIHKRDTPLNWGFRFKNLSFAFARKHMKGHYFSEAYSRDHYPRSKAGRGVSNSEEFQEVCRHSVDSDICRSIIDLDRYLYLMESGYRVWYKGELFVAERMGGDA